VKPGVLVLDLDLDFNTARASITATIGNTVFRN
jgi:hypothetical protein